MKAVRVRGLFLMVVACAALGCGSPYDAVIPLDPEVRDADLAFNFASGRLPERDRMRLAAWLAYADLAFSEGVGLLPGTTIGDALEAQASFQREVRALRKFEREQGLPPSVPRNTPVIFRLSR